MAVFKCKMCGGTLEINNETVAVCQYCGTKQTVPKSRDEVVANLFNRANNLRLKCEFDKAEQVYEKILDIDNSDSEAHWGVVLCKYGIEYVEDPKTYSRIPTCHRTLYEAVLTDVDYLSAIENADAEQEDLYIAEAKIIDELQKNILTIVNSEEPFDVFICYKETDEDGKRTVDSAIANDIYYQLTQEGFKVFYAPITLEDKLGYEYEPYIFAALNSAKVMLVVGTKPEYFDSVWVRNEWSRFIKLTKSDRSKMIIPCYRNMDAYELPDEFAHLQAQDMSKIGFITDVIRGLKKVFNRDESSQYTTIRVEKPVKKKANKTNSFLVNFKNKFKSNFQLTFKLPQVTAAFYVLTIIFYIYFLIKMGNGVTCGHDFFMFSLMGLPFIPPLLIFTKVIKKKSIAIIIEAITLLWNSIAYFSDIYYQISNGIFQATILMSLLCLIWLIAVCCTKRTEKKQTDNKKWFYHAVAIVLSIIFIVVYDMFAVPFIDYQFARVFYKFGAYDYATEYFSVLDNYKDSDDILKNIKLAKIKNATVGEYIEFGLYEQDGNYNNGFEPIEWLVLEKNDDKVLLISKYGLDCIPFTTEYVDDATWETSNLRNWLNNSFYNEAFSNFEKQYIQKSTIENYDYTHQKMGSGFTTESGTVIQGLKTIKVTKNPTNDFLFVLNEVEAETYFTTSKARKVEPTLYAKNIGADTSYGDGYHAWWWLRTNPDMNGNHSIVSGKGGISTNSLPPNCETITVRPVMWIELSETK